MGYSTVSDMISDVASFYNDTNALDYVLPEGTKRRILHYIQRSVDEIWYYRPWTFKMMQFGVNPGGIGVASLPFNFATVGPKGMVFEEARPQNGPWREVDYQEWALMRSNSQYWKHQTYCIGGHDTEVVGDPVGEGQPSSLLPQGGHQTILFPDPTEARLFLMHYESTPPRAAWDADDDVLDYGQPLPMHEGFHNAILLGTIAKLQEGKGDPRPQYRSEYVAAIATAAAQHLPLTSRMQQLPRALPGGQW